MCKYVAMNGSLQTLFIMHFLLGMVDLGTTWTAPYHSSGVPACRFRDIWTQTSNFQIE